MKYYPDSETSVVVLVNTDNSPADAQVVEGFVSLAVLEKKLPDLTTKEIDDFDSRPYLGNYQTVDNFYYGANDFSIVNYEGEVHLYRKPTSTDLKGERLYYVGIILSDMTDSQWTE